MTWVESLAILRQVLYYTEFILSECIADEKASLLLYLILLVINKAINPPDYVYVSEF